MNRRQLLRSAAAAPVAGVAFSAAAAQQKQLKITGLETDVLKRPPGTPTYDAIHKLGVESGSVVLRLKTDAGITGWASCSFGMIAGGPGVVQFALAAADIAVWDILGKHAGMPVYKMLGAYRDRIPVYSMCGWYYDNDNNLAHYRRSLEEAMQQGYRAVKIKVGRDSMDDD